MGSKYCVTTIWKRERVKDKYHYDAWVLYVLYNDGTYQRYMFEDEKFKEYVEKYKEEHNLDGNTNLATFIASGQMKLQKMSDKRVMIYIGKQIKKIKEES